MSLFFQRIHVHVPSSLARQPPPPPPHVAVQIEALRVPQPPAQPQAPLQRKRPLPKQLSCTESGSDFDGAAAAYARYFSRQNTSEDSANVTVSTVLAQSDSQSLHALPSYANTPTASAGRESLPERLKSRSTGLLPIRRTPEAVIIPMEGEMGVGYEQPLPAQLAEKLQRMTSTSTASSVAPTGCCSATKSMASKKPFQSFKPTLPMAAATAAPSTGSDDEYRRRKRKYSKNCYG